MALSLIVNGSTRSFEELAPGDPVVLFVQALGFRPDRVAVERNGEIVPRSEWPVTTLHDGDKFEVVHFVGGGAGCSLGSC